MLRQYFSFIEVPAITFGNGFIQRPDDLVQWGSIARDQEVRQSRWNNSKTST